MARTLFSLIWLLSPVLVILGGCRAEPKEQIPDRPEPRLHDLERGAIQGVLQHLQLAAEEPDVEGLVVLLSSGTSEVASDDVSLSLWLDRKGRAVWVRQAGGYPGKALWFGPGPVELLPAPFRPVEAVQPLRLVREQ